MRILFLLLISFSSFGQLFNNNMMLKSSRDSVEIPYPFFANSVDKDSIRCEWIDIGADTYVLQSDDNDDFSSPTTEYTGSNTSYTLTGLSANTKLYFRLKAQTAGLSDSRYAIDTCTTFPFTPVGFYEASGLDFATNQYFNYSGSGSTMDSVRSIINYSGPRLYTTGTKGIINFVADNWNSYPFYNHNSVHQPTTNYTFSGDFEINFAMYISGAVTNSVVFGNSGDAAQYIRFNSLSQIRFARTTGVTLTLDNTLESGKLYFFTFQRVGTTFTATIINPDGSSQTKSGTGPSTSVTFDRVFFASPKFIMKRLSFMDRALTTDERLAVVNYLKRKTFIPDESITSTRIKGVTFSNFTGPYLANSDFPTTVSGSFTRDKFFGFGDYSIATVAEKFTSPNYGEDLIYVFNDANNTVTSPISMGVPSTTEDDHNSGGICVSWNNMLVHFEQDKHYDDGGANTLIVKMFGKNMNLVGYKKIPLAKDVPVYNAPHLQYHQVCIINNKIYITAQEWSGGGSNAARRTVLLISDDEWNYFRKYQIIETDNGDGDFLYHNMLYSEDKIIITVDHEIQPGNDHRASYILVMEPAVDETVFYNVAGTHTHDVDAGPITLTEADANYLLGTAITVSPGDLTSVKQSHGLYDPNANEAYVVRFNGNDDGLVLCEVDFTAETITEYAIPETIDGHTIDVSCVGSGATNQPFVYKDSGTYYLICGEVNSGNTKIIRCSSTDGTTWEYVDQLSADDTKPHIRIMPTKNWYYTSNRSVWASRNQSTFGDLFKYQIQEP